MKHIRFVAVEDTDYGWLGIKFKNPKKLCNGRFTITTGDLLAHDCIEHQQGHARIGSIGDEMLALGGVCFARGQWGYLREDASWYTPVESLSHDITGEMARLYLEEKIPFRQKLVRCRGEDPSGIVDNVIECARENWDTQYESYDEIDAELRQADVDNYLESCRQYMLQGSLLSLRRFGSAIDAHEMFWEIERQSKFVLKDLEYPGQEFLLSYDFNRNVTFKEVHPTERY